jgi:hypothetical protein
MSAVKWRVHEDQRLRMGPWDDLERTTLASGQAHYEMTLLVPQAVARVRGMMNTAKWLYHCFDVVCARQAGKGDE